VTYTLQAPTTGNLTVNIGGLPMGANASVVVNGPGVSNQNITATATFSNIAPGSYSVTASNVVSGGNTYAPNMSMQNTSVTAGNTSSVTVTYTLQAPTTGNLTVTITGLPGGANAAVAVTGPGGFNQNLTATTTLMGLTPGAYTVAASNVVSGGTYAPAPTMQTPMVTAGNTANASVVYTLLQPTISNPTPNPVNLAANVNMANSSSFSFQNTGNTGLIYTVNKPMVATWLNITAGASATIAAGNMATVNLSGTCPATAGMLTTTLGVASNDPVNPNKNVTVNLQCTDPSITLDLTVAGFYITQATQTLARDVPLVAGRSGYARAFITANQAQALSVAVRLSATVNGADVGFVNLAGPANTQTGAINEGNLATSYNAAVPLAWMQPNLVLTLTVDPANAVPETNEANNSLVVNADVRNLGPFKATIVPVTYTGGIAPDSNPDPSLLNASLYDDFKAMMPVADSLDVQVAGPVSFSQTRVGGGDNAWWSNLLDLIDTTRGASDRYHYGLVNPKYTNSELMMGVIAGIGFIGAPSATGLDVAFGAKSTAAHEVGHNFGRNHAPCNVSGPGWPNDPKYAGGKIGVWGLDLRTTTLKDPTVITDLMGYCSNVWISDFTYKGALSFRAANPLIIKLDSQPMLVVSGTIVGNTTTVLSSFAYDTTLLDIQSSPVAVEVTDENGLVLRVPARLTEIADAPTPSYYFRATIPRSQLGRIGQMRVLGRGEQQLTLVRPRIKPLRVPQSAQLVAQNASVKLGDQRYQSLTVTWDSGMYQQALLRDGLTQEVLGLDRTGRITVYPKMQRRVLELLLSDGLNTTVQQVKW
jgi:hypothetical protein